MNIFDIILIAILVLATARGLFKGFVRELVSLGSIALGVFVASRFHDLLTPYLAQYMRNETSAMAASYLVLFLGTVFGAWILAKMFRTWTDDSVAGSIDTALGGLFGFCEGGLVSLVVVLMLATFLPDADFYKNSLFAPQMVPAAGYVAGFLPESISKAVTDSGATLPESPEAAVPEETE